MTTSAAMLPAALRPRQLLNWIGVAPFFLFATLFLILPTLNIVIGAFRNPQGQVTLDNGASNYSGATQVQGGSLITTAAERLSDASAVQVAAGAQLQLGGHETLAALQAAGSVRLAGNLTTTGEQVYTGSLTLETTTLDLKDAANRAAFDEFFITYGVDAGDVHAKVADIPLDGGIAGIAQRWDALQQRLDADGFEATYQYETSGDALSANGGEKAAKAGGWGVGGEKTSSGRELVSAVARDNRYGGTEVPLATCGK